jgi:hypothetical protein
MRLPLVLLAIASFLFAIGCSDPSCPAPFVQRGKQCKCPEGSEAVRNECVAIDGGAVIDPVATDEDDDSDASSTPETGTALQDDASLGSNAGPMHADSASSLSDATVADAVTVAQSDANSERADANQEAGTTPACAPAPEDCFNGKDDDCDNAADCADPDCGSRTTCTMEGNVIGLLVAVGDPCPTGYTKAPAPLHRDLTAGGCAGCSCAAPTPTGCNAALVGWGQDGSGLSSTAPCMNETAPRPVQVSSFTCSTESPLMGWLLGASVERVTTTSGTCAPQGQPRLAAPTWGETRELCITPSRGGGCELGRVCVPRVAQASLCTESSVATCPNGLANQTWFTGISDTRRCGACVCNAVGASCDGVQVLLGSDGPCDGAIAGVLSVGQKICGGPSSAIFAYSPGVRLTGTPVNATCQSSSALSGAATMSGGRSFCCE